jgi:hypothetical protein
MPHIPAPVTFVLLGLAVLMFITSRIVRRRNGGSTPITDQAAFVPPRQDAASLPVTRGQDQGRP